MIINHNMNAMNAHRMMGMNTVNSGKSMEKLSSGLRINRAGDDAAGLAISEKMRGQIRGLDQASRNAQDGISMLQTGEGSLNETHSILQRMKELATQAANDTNIKDDRTEIQKEMNQLTSEINRIGNTTEFNTQKLLDGGEAQRAATTTGTTSTVTEATVTGVKVPNLKLDGADITLTVGGKDVTLTKKDYTGKGADLATDLQAAIKAATGNDDVKVTFDTDKLVMTSAKDIIIAEKTAGDLAKLGLKADTTKVPAAGTGQNFTATLQIGANKGQAFGIEIADMRSSALGISKASSGTSSTAVAGATVTGVKVPNLKLDGADITLTVGGKDVTLTKKDYTGKGADLATDLQAAIKAATGNDDVKVTFDTDKLVMTSAKDIIIAEKTAGDLAKLGLKADTTKVATATGGTFTSEAGVSNGTTSALAESALDVSNHTNATNAIEVLDKAIAKVSGERSKLGAYQNRLEHTINNLGTSSENLQAAESRVRDVDMAKEMMNFSKNNILSQASQAMLAQAKQQPEGVLQLLR